MTKIAALGPAIDALAQTPTNVSKAQFFEQHVSEQAYQAFNMRHPDLVESIVTYKTVSSDPDAGTAIGAFVMDLNGKPAYVPVTFHEDEVAPLDILYLVDKDQFVPFTQDAVTMATQNSLQSLGEAEKLPPTVATDMDIRNLVVPPTTGRYSYASAYEQEYNTEIGRMAMKLAEDVFDPVLWEGFVSQFSQMNGQTPGVALDNGQMDLNILSKMYKSHQKTWQMPAEAAQAGAEAAMMGGGGGGGGVGAPQQPGMPAQGQPQAPQGMPQGQPAMGGGMPAQGAAPAPAAAMGAPKMASVPGEASHAAQGLFSRLGSKADDLSGLVAENAALGGLGGALTSVYDDDYSDMGGRALKGALGGTLGGTLGHALGGRMNKRYPQLGGMGDELGQVLGLGIGSVSAARPGTISNALRRDSGQVTGQGSMDPYGGMYRYASEISPDADVLPMYKHAFEEPHERPLRLLDALSGAPNRIKTAFTTVLKRHPSILKFAAQTYGEQPLLEALRPRTEKSAGVTPDGGLKVERDKSRVGAFGSRSGAAFRGIAMRGYYYEDDPKRPARNTAMVKQEYHDAHDAREPGVYLLWKLNGERVPALIMQNPVKLGDGLRDVFPHNEDQVTPLEVTAPGKFVTHSEPDTNANPKYMHGNAAENSHKVRRLVVLGNGDYFEPSSKDPVTGEMVTEKALEGTPVFQRIWGNKNSKPSAGTGIFVYQSGVHYYCTAPVTLSEISTTSEGVLTGILRDAMWGDARRFRMDPRSPMSKPRAPKDAGFVLLPANWRWVPLREHLREAAKEFVLNPTTVIELGLNAMGSQGARKVRVRSLGSDDFKVESALWKDSGPFNKAAALKSLADIESISGADAEACLKLAEASQIADVLIVPKAVLPKFAALVKKANAGDPMSQAIGETLGGLEQQVAQLQGQLQVLQTVQQRAQELSGQAPAAMQQTDPAMAAPGGAPSAAPAPAPAVPAPPAASMDPNAGALPAPAGAPATDPMAAAAPAPQDPAAMGAAPQDPNAMGATAPEPQLPSMPTEGPSSSEIAQQVNPTFMQNAADMNNAGLFDLTAITELDGAAQRAGDSASPLGDHKDGFSATIDDLGRTLLLLQMRAPELETQLGLEGYKALEDQTRNTFLGLGQLQTELSQNNTALVDAQSTERLNA